MTRPTEAPNRHETSWKENDMTRPGLMRRGRRIGLTTAALLLVATGAALAHSEGGGVAVLEPV